MYWAYTKVADKKVKTQKSLVFLTIGNEKKMENFKTVLISIV